MQAHKSQLLSCTGLGDTCVTSSLQGTIRLWRGADIAADAERYATVHMDLLCLSVSFWLVAGQGSFLSPIRDTLGKGILDLPMAKE